MIVSSLREGETTRSEIEMRCDVMECPPVARPRALASHDAAIVIATRRAGDVSVPVKLRRCIDTRENAVLYFVT